MQAKKLISTVNMSRADWLAWRRKGLGGSDASAIVNMNRYSSPLQVYLDKVGELPPVEENEYMYWGTQLEDIVAQEFAKRVGKRVRRVNYLLSHPEHDWMLGNIDRDIVGERAGLEVKTANEYTKEDWADEKVPKEYLLQCNHYMAVTGYERWYVAVLIGGNKFEWRVIERDDELIENLISIESNFWHNHVLAKNQPPYGAHDEALLKEQFPAADEATPIDLTAYYDDVKALVEARDRYKEAEFAYNDLKARVQGYMGTADQGYCNDQLVLTWKNTKRGNRQFKFVSGGF